MRKVQVKGSDGKVMFEIDNYRSYRRFMDITTKDLYIHLDGELRLFYEMSGIIRYDRTLATKTHKHMREKYYEDWYNKEYQDLQEEFREHTTRDYVEYTGYKPTDEEMTNFEKNYFRTWCKKNNYQPIF